MVEELDPEVAIKWQKLVDHIGDMGPVIVAFSGGVYSGLLATAAYAALGERMLAVTIHSPVDPPGDQDAAAALAGQVGFAHRVVEMNDLENPDFVRNPADRCYFCKRVRLKALQELGRAQGFPTALEGSNADDQGSYRPGSRAVRELGVRSPLQEVGINKAEIRALARARGLLVWDRPSAPCLATRFPYGTPITLAGLQQIGQAEAFLAGLGFQPLRARYAESLVRIEVAPAEMPRLVSLRAVVLEKMKELGFKYVAVDLEGYRSGSMDEVLK